MEFKTDKLTESQLQQIEKAVYDRVPQSKAEKNGTWCSAEKMAITRLRNNIRKRLMQEWLIEKVER